MILANVGLALEQDTDDAIRSLNSMAPADIPIYGYIYDCISGALVEVPEATAAGKASQEPVELMKIYCEKARFGQLSRSFSSNSQLFSSKYRKIWLNLGFLS